MRRILQLGKEGMARETLKEMALMSGKDKRPAWSRPNTFNVTADSGFWQSRSRPIFDKRVDTGMITAALKDGLRAFAAGGGEFQSEQEPLNPIRANEMKPAYPTENRFHPRNCEL